MALLLPFRKKLLPVAPSAVNVLWRSLVAHQRYDMLPTAPLDHVMRPPFPPNLGVTEFERHAEIFHAAHLWARQAIAVLEAEGDPPAAIRLSSADIASVHEAACRCAGWRRGAPVIVLDSTGKHSASCRMGQSWQSHGG